MHDVFGLDVDQAPERVGERQKGASVPTGDAEGPARADISARKGG